MNRTLMALALAGMAGALGGCGAFQDLRAVSEEFGKKGSGDDIATGGPLTLPPEASLRPPSTAAASNDGATRRAQVILRTDEPAAAAATPAKRGPAARETGPTAGERELMARSGVTRTTSDVVKRTVDIEQERSSSGQKEFTDRVLKYDPKAQPAKGDDKNARDATGDKPVIKRPGEL